MSSYTVDPKKLFHCIAKMNDQKRSAYILESAIEMMNGGKVEFATKVRGKEETGGYTEEFEQFWKAYPKGHKVGKGAAMTLFKKQGQPIAACLEALKWQIHSKKWKEGFIPNPDTYLRQRRYDDEAEETQGTQEAMGIAGTSTGKKMVL